VSAPRSCCDYHRLADAAGKQVGPRHGWLDTRIGYAITGKPEFAPSDSAPQDPGA
jgi:hypothetical protein